MYVDEVVSLLKRKQKKPAKLWGTCVSFYFWAMTNSLEIWRETVHTRATIYSSLVRRQIDQPTNRPINRSTNGLTWGGHGEVTLSTIHKNEPFVFLLACSIMSQCYSHAHRQRWARPGWMIQNAVFRIRIIWPDPDQRCGSGIYIVVQENLKSTIWTIKHNSK